MSQPPVKEIESPTGLDLYPEPPGAVRLSKRAGIFGLTIVATVVAMIGYGVITRKQRALQMVRLDDTKNLTAATDAGKVVAAQVPSRLLSPGTRVTDSESENRNGERLQSPLSNRWSPPSGSPVGPSAPHYRVKTPEEKRLLEAYQLELEALAAPTSAREGFANSTRNQGSLPRMPTREGDMEQMTTLLQAMRTPRSENSASSASIPSLSMTGSNGDGEDYESQNMQDRKEAFLARARSRAADDYLQSPNVRPISRYEIKAGWDIPAILEQALNSDLPGEVKALVRENVYDTASGRYLLIPQGSRLVGHYDSRIAYGQDGMMVVWTRIIYPDGSSVNLGGMTGQDAKGNAGLRHKVDHHYDRLLGFAALTSLFSAAFQLSQSPRGGLLAYPSAGEMAGSATGRELSQFGAQVTRRNLNVQPTIKVPIGYRFNVRVNRDMLFETAYRPMRM